MGDTAELRIQVWAPLFHDRTTTDFIYRYIMKSRAVLNEAPIDTAAVGITFPVLTSASGASKARWLPTHLPHVRQLAEGENGCEKLTWVLSLEAYTLACPGNFRGLAGPHEHQWPCLRVDTAEAIPAPGLECHCGTEDACSKPAGRICHNDSDSR